MTAYVYDSLLPDNFARRLQLGRPQTKNPSLSQRGLSQLIIVHHHCCLLYVFRAFASGVLCTAPKCLPVFIVGSFLHRETARANGVIGKTRQPFFLNAFQVPLVGLLGVRLVLFGT
jgi:hypothetical protein